MTQNRTAGHLAALLTILIWGTTFISTKVLLKTFSPVEILFIRFVMGFAALLLIFPRSLGKTSLRQELTFAAAGLTGICLYYLLENIALTCTSASNVGVIVSAAPFFTGIMTHIFLKEEEKLRGSFFLGFLVAMTGICLISFNGTKLSLNPMGDLLSLLAALVWSFYSVLTKKISGYGYSTVLTTRRTFFYGILSHAVLFRLSSGTLPLCRSAEPGEYILPGTGRLCTLLCHLELRRKTPGNCEDQRIYLHRARDYRSHLRDHPSRKNHAAVRSRHCADHRRTLSV